MRVSQGGSTESPFPQTTSLGPGSLPRRCTMSTAGGGWFALAGEWLILQRLLWRCVCVCEVMEHCLVVVVGAMWSIPMQRLSMVVEMSELTTTAS